MTFTNKVTTTTATTALFILLAACQGGVDDHGNAVEDDSADALSAMQSVKLPATTHALVQQGSDLVLASDTLSVTLPGSARDAIRAQISGVAREVRIVGAPATSHALALDASTVVYPGTGHRISTAASVVVSDDDTVIETYSIFHDKQAAEQVELAVSLQPGESLKLLDDHDVGIVGAHDAIQATFEAPWAKDATGRAVPYTLAVSGDHVVMTVSHHGGDYAYPIVADPALRVNCGWVTCSLYFSRSLTSRMRTPTGVVWALGAACGAIPPPFDFVCWGLDAVAGALSVKAGECAPKNQCLRVRFLSVPPYGTTGLYCDSSGYCSN